MYRNKICGLILIFFLIAKPGMAQPPQFVKYNTHFGPVSKPSSKNIKLLLIQKQQSLPAPLSVIAPDYYTQHFGFFCKKELAVEKFTKIPFRFRLGSLQLCNYYEGKK